MIRTVDELATWVASAPAGTLVPVEQIRECLVSKEPGALRSTDPPAAAITWRENTVVQGAATSLRLEQGRRA